MLKIQLILLNYIYQCLYIYKYLTIILIKIVYKAEIRKIVIDFFYKQTNL